MILYIFHKLQIITKYYDTKYTYQTKVELFYFSILNCNFTMKIISHTKIKSEH